MRTAIVYWSGTGNTEAMAQAVANGIRQEGGDVYLSEVGEAQAEEIAEYDRLALGCPSMGAEQLEEDEMEPFVSELEKYVSGKKLLLFGSYGWGDGEWMRDWCQRMEEAGACLTAKEGIIANEKPDEEALDVCRMAGKRLAS